MHSSVHPDERAERRPGVAVIGDVAFSVLGLAVLAASAYVAAYVAAVWAWPFFLRRVADISDAVRGRRPP